MRTRVTITAAGLGVAIVAVLLLTHWSTVRDHAEAWHFQLVRETGTISPSRLGSPLVFDPAELEAWQVDLVIILGTSGWRVLEQRFPRRAFVVFHDPGP